MYNIDLEHITLHNAQNEVLKACENLCDAYHLEDQFGIISFGMHELVSLLERSSNNQDATFTINFYIERDKIAVQVLDFKELAEVAQWISTAQLEDADTTAYTVATLTNKCELLQDGKELRLEIEASPVFDTIDRSSVLQQEAIRKEENARRF